MFVYDILLHCYIQPQWEYIYGIYRILTNIKGLTLTQAVWAEYLRASAAVGIATAGDGLRAEIQHWEIFHNGEPSKKSHE